MHVCNWLPGLVPCSNWAEFEEYEKIFLNVPSVKIDVQCCINMINGIFTERKD